MNNFHYQHGGYSWTFYLSEKENRSLIRFLVITLFSALIQVFLFPYDGICKEARNEWISVPIRTANQRQAGLAGGEGFQYVMDISYAPSDSSIAYFCVDTSRIWKSTDGGSTWRHKSRGFLANGVRSIIVDPKNPDIVFAAGFLGYDAARGSKYTAAVRGIFRTMDGGEHWNLMRETGFFKQESKGRLFAFDSSSCDVFHASVVFAGSYSEGLLKSADSGVTWNCVGFKGKHIVDIEEDPLVPGRLLVATEEGPFRYSGRSIESLGTGLPSWPRSIAVHHQNPKIIYVAVGKYGVYKSTDGGKSFERSSNGLPTNVFCADIACSRVDSNIVYISFQKSGTLNPYYSHDAGKTWKGPVTIDEGRLSHAIGQWFSSAIAPHPSDGFVALVCANGAARILKTVDGGKRWAYSSTGFTGGNLGVGSTSLGFSPDGKMAFFLIDHGWWLTEDRGDTFRNLELKRIKGLGSSPVGAINGDIIVAAVGSWGEQGIEVSKDCGVSWNVFDNLFDDYRFISFHPQEPSIIYAQRYRSDDGGCHWIKLKESVRAVYRKNGDIVYAISASSTGKAVVKKSIDRGTSWKSPYGIPAFNKKGVYEIAVAPDDQDRLYVATTSGIWVYHGGRWRQRGPRDGLAKDAFGWLFVKCICVDPNNPKVIYAGRWAPSRGQSNGIFRSTDGGITWKNISWNLGPELSVGSVSVSPLDSAVYIGTSLGTWKYEGDETQKISVPSHLWVE